MSAPLYFLPGLKRDDVAPGGRLNQRLLAERGLAHVFGDVRSVSLDAALMELRGRGPDDHSGVILCALPNDRSVPRRLGYYPDAQRWHPGFVVGQAAEIPPFYLGIDPGEPPAPDDVARNSRFHGYKRELGDGQEWEVPILRAPDGNSSLPRALGWSSATGEFEQSVKAEYRDAWDAAADTSSLFYDPDDDRARDYEQMLLRCLQALGLNYRIGPVEQTVLELIDTNNWEDVLGATVDLPKVIAAAAELKKKRDAQPSPASPPSPSSSPGEGDSTPATDPVAATST